MDKGEQFVNQLKERLSKAVAHLEYSYQKVLHLPIIPNELNEQNLETWESFCARFSRVVDVFLMQYVKAQIKLGDPGFDGTLRDFLHQAEKIGLIDNTRDWIKLRELRNIASHEYTDTDLMHFLKKLRDECPKLFEIKKIL